MKTLTQSLFIVLSISGLLSYAVPTPTLTTILAILLHSVAGIVFSILLIIIFWRNKKLPITAVKYSILLTTASGIVLLITAVIASYNSVLLSHISISVVSLTLIIFKITFDKSKKKIAAHSITIITIFVTISSIWLLREKMWQQEFYISNSPQLPKIMNNKKNNSQQYFLPSASKTKHRSLMPEQFFLESKLCRHCHQAIYQQWNSSAHHFSSFNNPWYLKTIELLQQTGNTKRSKFCAGCHDPALLFTGKMTKTVKELRNTKAAQVGIACVTCHAMVTINGSIGQGAYTLEYPDLHKLSTSKLPLIKAVRDFVIKLNPEPHRRAFLKPFMRDQSAQFCSSCHKVHLDKDINNYRWLRGFNEYDSWQSSGISGQAAGAFYYPLKNKRCVDCHMPVVSVENKNNSNNTVRSHRFAAANTALAFFNQDQIQLAKIRHFLQNDALTVDIFALNRVIKTTADAIKEHPATNLTAPLNAVTTQVHTGDTINIDVVVRNKNVGHRFPGGTADAFDIWLELLVLDENGVVIAENGKLKNNALDKDAHQFHTLLVDDKGNAINKRNSWQARALIYDNRIPPGTAKVIHYRYTIPQKKLNRLIVQARLHYRKFSQSYTQYVFQEKNILTTSQSQPFYKKQLATNIAKMPIVTLAKDEITLQVLTSPEVNTVPKLKLHTSDWQRWTDYGIGLLLQQDLIAAEIIFKYAQKINPQKASALVNLGRVYLKQADTIQATKAFKQALHLDQKNSQAHLFYAVVLQLEGELQLALKHLQQVLTTYPNDRMVNFRIARIFYLQDDYKTAITYFKQVLMIDPEDVKAHYNLMLCYQALQQPKLARLHQQYYLKLKSDDSSQAIAGRYRTQHSDANRESQAIHFHELHQYFEPVKSSSMAEVDIQ
ncbi:TPR-repeat-containing protein [hydrothermal vent metagenome]|uniref:TPR-repeat-containing protein n=1 Tax=hydrothermal vent metagenome TaxID=652676 RepID=A0A3B0ZZ75_9ZZZZ